jgi:hypothetical protein
MRRPIQFFVSYAHANTRLADDLLRRLVEQLGPSSRYEYQLWRDPAILAGEFWDREIHQALDTCDLGLLLVSPAFLASEYVTREELPRFVGNKAKPIIPVMLEPVDFRLHDLKGLEAHQIYRLNGQSAPRAYADCTTDKPRRQFAEGLFHQIEARLDKLFPSPSR